MDIEQLTLLKEELGEEYRDRHEAFRKLRDYWFGRYWQNVQDESRSLSSLFKDLVTPRSDVGPDVKLVYNVLQMVCVKYQTYLSPLPMIRVYTDPPHSENRRAQATKKERYLYGVWQSAKMTQVLNRVAWYQPLMGDCFLGIWPDPVTNIPRPVLRSPEYAYPVPSYDTLGEDAQLFSWTMRESAVKRQFPKYKTKAERARARTFLGMPLPQTAPKSSDPDVEIIEWSDTGSCLSYADGLLVRGVDHQFGFNLFQHLKFIDVPNEVWGHGAVEQIAGMNEMTNATLSLIWEAMIQNVFPRLVLINPSKAPEEIETGPGAVIPINEGGNVAWLHPPVQAVQSQVGFVGDAEQKMRLGSGMPGVNFGESPASSIVTGKAVNELQGAGTGSTVEMVQGQLGLALSTWNQQAIFLQQSLFKDESVNLYGQEVNQTELNPRRFALTMKGSELIGSGNNEVVFMPHLNLHEKMVMWLQALGGGLVSQAYVREQIGVADGEAMEEDILREKIQQMVLDAAVGQLQQSPTPQTAQDVEKQGFAYLQGATGDAHPLLSGPGGGGLPPGAPPPGAPPGGGGNPQFGPIAPGASGQTYTPGLPMPPGAPMPGGGPTPPGGAPTADQGIQLQDAVAAFNNLVGIDGRVFLVGQLVQQGAAPDLEVALTDQADRDTISKGLPQYRGKITFHAVADAPTEPYVEVTPGQAPQQGGNADQAAAMIGG